MFFLQANLVAADSTAVAAVEQTVEKIKSMPLEDAMKFITKGLLSFGWNLLIAVIIFFIGRWIIRYLDRVLERIFMRRNVEISLSKFVRSFVRVVLYTFLVIAIIKKLGIDTSSFVALFASAGVAIGLALSGTLQNFAGGIMLLILRPFRIGDYVQMQGNEGVVKEIKLFNTIVNTADNKLITVPNGSIINNVINNYSAESQRRIDWTVTISYGDDYDVARETLLKIIASDKRVLSDPAPFIALGSLGNNSVNLVVRAWVKSPDYWDVFFNVNEKIYKQLPEAGIHFPFPQLDVHVTK